ncbi:hypothetical protein PsorP6_003042 [Peronosclerospora sorghi]|uniref:Uncharacterized protein n=1 Tax=Peronosclerospora sorghi TaxID=230839 RepID=A0ACC0VLE5_9STRA|nr:hypothetical protein PsorP6_003042 [Peronosclerospora sorghi]
MAVYLDGKGSRRGVLLAESEAALLGGVIIGNTKSSREATILSNLPILSSSLVISVASKGLLIVMSLLLLETDGTSAECLNVASGVSVVLKPVLRVASGVPVVLKPVLRLDRRVEAATKMDG